MELRGTGAGTGESEASPGGQAVMEKGEPGRGTDISTAHHHLCITVCFSDGFFFFEIMKV